MIPQFFFLIQYIIEKTLPITLQKKKSNVNCESCMNYEYDEEYEYYVCAQNLDEDEMYRFVQGSFHDCPYYQFGDEYRIVRKQM